MRLQINVPDEEAGLIQEFLADNKNVEFCSHGALTMKALAEMLMQDVALAVRRPGSWEGANMITVLQCHGYKNI